MLSELSISGHHGSLNAARGERSAGRTSVWMLVMVSAVLLIVAWQAAPVFDRGNPPRAAAATVPPPADLTSEENATIELFKDTSPSVVHINTSDVRRRMFSTELLEIPRGSGSGFVWDKRGHIVTNWHVVADSEVIRVTLADRSTWVAKIVGSAREKDLAVIRIAAEASALHPLARGSSSNLQVGQKVYAIGNPFGLDHTLTTGVLSAVGRDIQTFRSRTIRDVIQTDAAINPGNSGGPLLDSSARLIGVNTQIVSPSGAFAGIGFAIPVDTVNWVVPQLVQDGKLNRPLLGVELASERWSHYFEQNGLIIMRVNEGSGAAEAGLRPAKIFRNGDVELGDVITAVDGEKVATRDELLHLLERHRPGETVSLEVLRGGRDEAVIPVRLGGRN